MSKKQEQIKMINDLYEAGSISESEKSEMLAVLENEQVEPPEKPKEPQEKDKSNNKKTKGVFPFILIGIIILLVGYFMGWFTPNSNNEEIERFVEEKCACDSITNNAIKQRYNELIDEIRQGKFQYRNAAEEERVNLESKINSGRISAKSMKCKKQLELLESKYQQDFPLTSKKGREFWNELEQKKVAKEDFNAEAEIDALLDKFEKEKATIPFQSASELFQKKEQLKTHLNSFFNVYGSAYFDAYNWFASEINQYILSKNVNPEYINNLFKNPEGDRQNNTFQWHPETLMISSKNGKEFNCICMVDYTAWRPSKSQYQHSLVTYEIVLNENNLISSIIEKKVENTRYD